MLKGLERYLSGLLIDLGYEADVAIISSSRPELGSFQLNICMGLAKKYHKNPIDVANEIISKLDSRFTDVNVAGPGFINFNLSEEYILSLLNRGLINFNKFLAKGESKKILIDFGGANAAKALHVGHMRSANIGEALRRLAKTIGYEVISDVHLGDLGRQAGMLLSEMKKRGEYLGFFNKNFKGEYRKVSYTPEDLGEMYVAANVDANNSEERMAEVREITAEIDKGNKVYLEAWKQLVDISSVSIKKVYNELNCHFDLFKGELDALADVPVTISKMQDKLYESNGALVIDVKEESDTKEMPPLIVIKKDGATIYATRDLATIYRRQLDYKPDEIWYVVDNRQSLYFEQLFRASYKTNLVDKNCNLKFLGFGTVNGSDGKPYKTRDGGVMELENLIRLIEEKIDSKMKEELIENREEIVHKLSIATLKFADLMSYRSTDYIFDLEKFSSFDGKTGPYILYTVVRLKSILEKSDLDNYNIKKIENAEMRDILLKIIEITSVLEKSLYEKSLNFITDYLFDLSSLFNRFYNTHHILTESNVEVKNSYLSMLKLTYMVISKLLYILAIDEVERM